MPHLSRSYLLGIVFIITVAVIWAASSVLTQYLYTGHSFGSPFLLTYIGVSLFSILIPTKCLGRLIKEWYLSRQGEVETDYPRSGSPVTDYRDDASAAEDTDFVRIRPVWTQQDHFRAACWIAPVWFIANWAYNASLLYTSISSSTVFASTGTLFTFIFAVGAGDESFNYTKLAGVLMGVSGSIITALGDAGDDEDDECVNDCTDALFGDMLSLISAIGYGAYAVQTRVLCPHDESLYSMQLMLGYIGLLSLFSLMPVAIWQAAEGAGLSAVVVGCLILKGLFDNVLSDYLWLRAVILTSATVATVGLGLTIPLAFGSDLLMGKPDVLTFGSVLGACGVLAGFVLVNVGNEERLETHTAEDLQPIHAGSGEEEEGVALHNRQPHFDIHSLDIT